MSSTTWRVNGPALGSAVVGSVAIPVITVVPPLSTGDILVAGVSGLAGLPLVALLVLLAVRPFLRLDAQMLTIRNPLRTVTVPLAAVVRVSGRYGGLRIELADGSVVGAWAVQKSNAMTWLGWRTRADHIADQIEEAAAKARAVSA